MKLLKRITAFFLSFIMIISLLPPAQAADGEAVLKTLGHSETNVYTFTNTTTREVTLTVPFNFLKTDPNRKLDLFTGIVMTYDETKYKNVVLTPASEATVDGARVSVVVTFNNISDADGAEKSETEYFIKVVRAAQIPASFSGAITKNVINSSTYTISETDILSMYDQHEGELLSYITVSGSNLVAGTLKHNGVFYDLSKPDADKKVDAGDIGTFTFTAAQIGKVSYNINAFDSTDTLIGTAVVTFLVYQVPEINSPVTKVGYTGSSVSFTASDFTSKCELYAMPLESIVITPLATDSGTWYNGTLEITEATPIAAESIGNLRFVCEAVGTARFNWSASNEGGYSALNEESQITVEAPTIVLNSYSSSTTVAKGNVWTIAASNFGYSPSTAKLTFIKISAIPASADGYIYLSADLPKSDEYAYPAITKNTALKVGAVIPYSLAKNLRLSTKSTSTNNYISFKWTATADSGVVTSATWADDATYTVRFLEGGNVSYSTYANMPVKLSGSDFSSQFSSSSGYALSYVLITLPAKTSGTLYYEYDQIKKTGKAVTATTKYYPDLSPSLSSLTFVPATDYSGTVTITYKAYKADGTFLAGKLYIYVMSSSGGSVAYTTDKNSAVQVDAADFSKAFLKATGQTLSYVYFTLPETSHGKLYYDYVSETNYESTVSSSRKYYVYSEPYLSYVSFVPYKNYTGIGTVTYTAYDKSGNSYTGRMNITVVDSPAGIVQYSSKINDITNFTGGDFADEFISVTGSVLSYVQFTTPKAEFGALYYQYSTETSKGTKVTNSTKYYNGASPDISDLCFVPAKDYTGEVVINYTVYTASAVSYVGKLKIRVGEGNPNHISYKTELNTPIRLISSDFVTKFSTDSGGSTLSAVTFDLPSSSYGKLYYNYINSYTYDSAVTSGTTYNVNSFPFLSTVSFVPRTGYSGTFTIPYTAYDSSGKSLTGKISITVKGGEGTVEYKTVYSKSVTFASADFRQAFEESSGQTLSYVKFVPPSSSYGTLYYGYNSSSSYSSTVSSTTKYYAYSYPYISYVTFVPNSSFSGAVTIYYTAYTESGDEYGGNVVITVSSSYGGRVNYKTAMNTSISLDSDDFVSVFNDGTSSTLRYLRFTLPSSTVGTLYSGYSSSSSYSSKVTSGTYYYVSSSPLISNISFVPYTGYFGTVTIPYTAYNSNGDAFSGELVIEVVQPFNDISSGYSWSSSAVSYLYNKGIVQGSGNGNFNPGHNMSRGDFMLMVYRAFSFKSYSSDSFTDVAAGSYYYEAISAAKSLGIAKGENGKFYPEDNISRQDAMVIILRTLELVGKAPEKGTAANLEGFIDAGEVSDYAVTAVATLVKAGVIGGSDGYLSPQSMMSRAEMAVLLHRVLVRQ